jgi:hypothetical protein
MNKQQLTLMIAALALMGGAAGALSRFSHHHSLGAAGIKTRPTKDPIKVEICLPETVAQYDSREMEADKSMLDYLPPDTSYVQRIYAAPDGFQLQAQAVLMGTDRTSIHKPERCLPAQGWAVDESRSGEEIVHIQKPHQYDLPVMKLLATKSAEQDGKLTTWRGIYVYWFIADNQLATKHTSRMWREAKDLLLTGTMERWAYVSFFAACRPEDEAATFERMKAFIAAATPEFQLFPGPDTPSTQMPLAQANNK